MKYLLIFIIGLATALALFLLLTFTVNNRQNETLALNSPIVVLMKATVTGQPMNFWTLFQNGANEAAREFGVKLEFTGPDHEKQIQRQINILNRIIEEDPPLIILAASDYYLLKDAVENAAENHIPVIVVDSGVDSSRPISFIGTNNMEAGLRAGKEMKRILGKSEGNSIAIVSHIQETATAIEREAGVRQALDGWDLAGSWYCDIDEKIAYKHTMEILDNPEITGIVALNEIVTLGTVRAVVDAGAEERISIVGFDSAPEELAFLEQGVLDATVVQRPYNMGYVSVKTAVDHLRGEQVESVIDTESVLITADNMFNREYQKLLFPVNAE